MNYHKIRNQEIKIKNLDLARKLASDYNSKRKTIILLPGGGGSELKRSTKRFNKPTPGSFEYDEVWIDEGIFVGDALKLKIESNGHDKDDHIIVPNGALDYLVKAYDGTKEYFKSNKYNYIEYGFDWRRPISEWASLLEEFLIEFKNRVMSAGEANPLSNTTLICHSHGGLIATQFLQNIFYGKTVNSTKVSEWVDRIITVGTPFYANSGHIRRYYRGEKALPDFLYDKKELAKTMGSMPGPYIFLYLDKETFNKDVGDLEINEYPIVDADDETIEVDPFNESSLSRFPPWVNPEYLKAAKKARQEYCKKLPKAVRDRIFHLRGYEDKRTLNRLRWKNINGSTFDPYLQKAPIKIKSKDYGPGDGTVPAWGARLAQIPLDRTYNLKKAKKHQDLMEHQETLNVMDFIIRENRLPHHMEVKNTKFVGVKPASRPTVENFLLGIKGKTKVETKKIAEKEATNPKLLRAILKEIDFA